MPNYEFIGLLADAGVLEHMKRRHLRVRGVV